MSFYTEQRAAELEEYRQTKAYYAAIRRPWLERVTFANAALAATAVSLRRFGIGITDYEGPGQWLTLYYWIAFIFFIGLDSLVTRARHPIPIPFGGLNPSRAYEKFAMQERSWQLLVVLMLPLTARFIRAILFFVSTH